MISRLLILAHMVLAAPASAADGIQISEPSNLALMGLGLAGLIIGRHTARSKRSRDDRAPKD
ncbi:MAG: PEP-CTERM sorting domain-containing protein [Allopontixanthobacter sp.]|nr:PEP-CTERM sorting domain-containing protein [Allopontixanthobacter sp.]